MLLELVRVVFGCGEGETWCDDTLNCRVIGKVEEQRDTV